MVRQTAMQKALRGRLLQLLLAGAVLVPEHARADVPVVDTTGCDADSAARLRWLVDRLESRERYADLWWRGWFGFYGLGVIIQSVSAGLEDDEGEQADLVVSAVKALGGVTRLYFDRPVARLGADPILGDQASCRERVEKGEELLKQAAKETDRRWDWKAHASNVGINVAGGLIVAEGFDEDDGWISAGVGIAVGEVMLWSHPWTGRSDLEEYEARFAPAERTSWSVVPFGRGVQVQMRF
jgi:hypothetical protein